MSTERPKLILINGQPGTGKTTLKKRLTADLDLPVFGKDDIKEFLFDTLEVDDTKWPGLLGRVSSVMLQAAAQACLQKGQSVLAESAFIYEFARPDWLEVIKATSADVLELYCGAAPLVRRQRFDDRIATGNRHPSHIDAINSYSEEELEKRYAPLELSQTVYVDTTEFSDADYKQLLAKVRVFLGEE